MQITGKDELSLKILEAINNGTKIKNIPKKSPVSLGLYTICWGLETFQKIRHVGSDFFYTGFGQPTKKGATCQLNRNIFLPGLKDVKINKVEICEHSIHLYVEMPGKPHRCPRCGAEVRKIHDYRVQKIRHLKWFERPTVLFYSHKTQQFLLKHLGIYEEKLVLARRLDSNWQKSLKKKGVLNISIPQGKIQNE